MMAERFAVTDSTGRGGEISLNQRLAVDDDDRNRLWSLYMRRRARTGSAAEGGASVPSQRSLSGKARSEE
jgi:hypothetical protein